jgi:hypothetical protein
MSNNGGLAKFRLPTGVNLSIRGSLTRNPYNLSSEAVVNMDGSHDRSHTVVGFRFGLSLASKDTSGNPVNVRQLMEFDKVDFTFLHDTEGMDYTYTRASLTGDPQIDGMTGELSGITGVSEGYLETRR